MSNPYVRGMSKVRPAAHLRSVKKFNPASVENAILASQLVCHREKHWSGKLVFSAPHTRLQRQINIFFLVFTFPVPTAKSHCLSHLLYFLSFLIAVFLDWMSSTQSCWVQFGHPCYMQKLAKLQ